MLREHTFDTGTVAINYAEGPPSGPPLVLLHGVFARWRAFLPIIPALSMRWRVYALDLRGHGKSGRVPRKYRPEDYIGDCVAFLQHQLAEPAILLGHSAGGLCALGAAVQLPEKLRAVIICDAPLSVQRWAALESNEARIGFWATLRNLAGLGCSAPELASLLADIPVSVSGQDKPGRYADRPGVDAASLRDWAQTLGQLDPEVLTFHIEGCMRECAESADLDAWFRHISCPVLLLQGNPLLGGLMADRDVEHALSVFPEAYHVRIQDAGHDLGLSTWQVAPLLTALTNFLESL